jgi:hypothetical protein
MARSFNGSSDKITIASGISALFPASVTMSIWFYNYANAYNTLQTMGDPTNGNIGIKTYVKSNGTMAAYRGSTSIYDGTGAVTVSANTWAHFALTGATATDYIGYVNGVVDKNAGGSAGAIDYTNAIYTLGIDGNGNHWMGGNLAEAAVWNTILTPGEVSSLALGLRPPAIRPANLISYLPVDGISSPEPDFSGNAFNGTLTGTAAVVTEPPIAMFTPRWPQFLTPPAAAGGVGFGALLSTERSRIVGAGLVLS